MIQPKTYTDITNNPYLQVLYEIHNRIWELRDRSDDINPDTPDDFNSRKTSEQVSAENDDLITRGYSYTTLPENTQHDVRKELSIKNISLEPITFTVANTNVRGVNASNSGDLWVHISTEFPANHITPTPIEANAWVQQIPVRIEVFLQQADNHQDELTIRSNKIANDIWLALYPDYFTALPFVNPFETMPLDELRNDIAQSTLANKELLQDILNDYHEFTLNRSQLQGFRINNAGIQRWGPVNDFRGTNEEILVFIFQYELVRYVSSYQEC